MIRPHALDAKSHPGVPTDTPSGSATTVNNAVSGMAPPLVMAQSAASARPQLAFTRRDGYTQP